MAGAGLRALAEVLLGWGWQLSGSDLWPESLDRLAGRGCVCRGHAAGMSGGRIWSLLAMRFLPTIQADRGPSARDSRRQLFSSLRTTDGRPPGRGHCGNSRQVDDHGHAGPPARGSRTRSDGRLRGIASRAGDGRPGGAFALMVAGRAVSSQLLAPPPAASRNLGDRTRSLRLLPDARIAHNAFARFAALLPDDGLLVARHECVATRNRG